MLEWHQWGSLNPALSYQTGFRKLKVKCLVIRCSGDLGTNMFTRISLVSVLSLPHPPSKLHQHRDGSLCDAPDKVPAPARDAGCSTREPASVPQEHPQALLWETRESWERSALLLFNAQPLEKESAL